MSLITEAVQRLETQVCGSGCEDNIVTLKRNPDGPVCQYVRGVTVAGYYGGRIAHITTNFPIEANTRVSFMFGAALDTAPQRMAALGIMNAVLGFLCLERTINACGATRYSDCQRDLTARIRGRSIYPVGTLSLPSGGGEVYAANPAAADIILITGDGLCTDEGLALCEQYRDSGRLLFIGPETSGLCSLLDLPHWCPYGRASPGEDA
ncbi:MAG: hypothetical protein APR53_07715 [Methanoculleus sp. SDB]|nr:MAG: hypothetical protein APR53_07715 [Methanoculleus sp. SDB]